MNEMKQKQNHRFLKRFCKDSSCERNKTLKYFFHFTLPIIIAHPKLDDQTYALQRVDIYRQSLIKNDIHHGDPLGGVHVADNLHHLLPVHSPAPILIVNPAMNCVYQSD